MRGKMSFSYMVICWIAVFLTLLATSVPAQDGGSDITIGKSYKVQSAILGEERTISVYLPVGYEESSEALPVLFLLDGEMKTLLMTAASAMEDIDWKGAMPQMIVVGIDNPNATRDYFPIIFQDRPGTGQADNFIRFLAEELIPWVGANFRTVEYRILCGCSNAGLLTVYTYLTKPETFNAYIAPSPSIGWFKDYMLELMKTSFEADRMAGRPIYMNYATDDFEDIVTSAMPDFTEAFRTDAKADVRWTMEVLEGAGHVPYVSIHNGLRFIFDGWKYPPEKLQSDGLKPLKEYYKNLSNKFGFAVKVPSGTLRDLGMDYYQGQEYDKAIEIFSFYIEEHPNHVQAYYLLGASYDKKGDRKLAIKFLEKAIEKDPEFTPAKTKLEQLKSGD